MPPYTQEQYYKLSILHPLIEDALNYACETLERGNTKASILVNLETLYGLTDTEAQTVLRIASRITKIEDHYHPNR